MPLAEVRARSKNHIRAVRHLVENLRLIKSSAEIEKMKFAGKVTSQVWCNALCPTGFSGKAHMKLELEHLPEGEVVHWDCGSSVVDTAC